MSGSDGERPKELSKGGHGNFNDSKPDHNCSKEKVKMERMNI
jgi:hypothetical protein